MKKFGNVVLTIVMLCLIMLLCVNLSIKTMSTKAITNAVVVQEASNGIEEVLNQAFPDVSNENIKKVEEAVKNNSALNDVTSDLLDQITAAVANGTDVDTAAIAAQLSKAVDENIPAIEEAIGKKITTEQREQIQSKITDENGALQNKIVSTVEKVQKTTPGTQKFIKTYKTLSDTPTRIICVVGIILTAVLLGLINKSFYKWTLFSGIAAVISGIVVGLFMPLVVSAMEFTIGNRLLGMSIDIPVGSLRLDGAICAGAGIILIVAYIILNKKYATFERHYY